MSPNKLMQFLSSAIREGEQVLVKGAPGIGKTDVIKQAAADAGAHLVMMHPAVSDPTDFKGLPAVAGAERDHASFLPFGEMWTLIQSTEPTVCFVDDLGQAPESVQKALMQVLWGRRLNGHVLPDTVTFVGATNDVGDRAGVSGLIEPVKSRFSAIVRLDVSLNDWCEWAINTGQPVEVIAFVRTRPELLHAFEPTREITNSPCPRTWAAVGRMINAGLADEFEVLAGAVGKGPATEFVAFREMMNEAPSLDAILLDPRGEQVPEKPALRYAVATGLAARMGAGNIDAAMIYLQRMPQPFRVLAMRDATRRDKRLAGTKAFVVWATSDEGKELFAGAEAKR